MKFFQHILIFALALATTTSSFAQKYEDDGVSSRQTRDVGDFSSFSVGGGIDVYVTQGNSYKVEVEAASKHMDKLKTVVKNGKLKIYVDGKIRYAKKLDVHLTVRDLKGISASGGSDVESTGALKFTDISINGSGGSDVELELFSKDITVSTSGGSDVVLDGSAINLTLSASGGSDFDGYQFKVKNATVNASGGSDSNVFVTNSLTVHASGASDVNYKGNPKDTTLKSSGSSDIHSQD